MILYQYLLYDLIAYYALVLFLTDYLQKDFIGCVKCDNKKSKKKKKIIKLTAEFSGSYRFLSGIKGSGLWSNRMGL